VSTADVGVAAGLAAVAAAFAPAGQQGKGELVYGPLVGQIRGGPAPRLELAVELVYEGYLAHYRTSRTVPTSAGEQVLLLAGDYFYAHGLKMIAATGDIGAVGLLTRLMGACAVARAEGLPFKVDDGLWEIAVSAVAAAEGSAARAAAHVAFDAVEEALAGGRALAAAAAAERGVSAVRGSTAEGG
jgi:hypothetical protein